MLQDILKSKSYFTKSFQFCVRCWDRTCGVWNYSEQGECCGERTRLPPIWPGFNSGLVRYVGWVCCWFSPCCEGFSPGSPVFLPPQNKHLQIQFDQLKGSAWKPAKVDVASSLIIVIYLFRFLMIDVDKRDQWCCPSRWGITNIPSKRYNVVR